VFVDLGEGDVMAPRLARLFFALGIAATIAFAQPASPALAAGGHAVFGNVEALGADWSGYPLAGVTVRCGTGRTLVTGADGSYRFEGVPDGTYDLVATAAGRKFRPGPVPITVAGADVRGPAFATGVSISGRIRRPDGSGVAGLRVCLSWMLFSNVTGSDGAWRIDGLPAGPPMAFSVAADGFFTATFAYSVRLYRDGSGYDFVPYRVMGRVLSAAGAPVANVWMRLSTGSSTRTDSDGYYVFDRQRPGAYTTSCIPIGEDMLFSPASRSAEATTSDARGVDFFARGVRTISGHVSSTGGSPVAGVTITCLPWGSLATSDANGDYTITDVPDGSWRVVASMSGLVFTPAEQQTTVAGTGTVGLDFIAATRPTIATRAAIRCSKTARVRRAIRLTGTIALAPAASSVRVTFTRFYRGKWRSAGSKTVPVTGGRFAVTLWPRYRGVWRATARYAGASTAVALYAPSWSRATFRVY
jgi:hypothetical protein